MTSPGPRTLVTDFDGTLTRHDFFRLVVDRCFPPDAPDYWTDYRAGRITHFEALKGIYSWIRADDAAMEQILTDMELDPRLAESVARLEAAGWQVIVTSAGCLWYIERLFARAGVRLPVYSNPGHFEPDRGLVLELPTGSRFFSPTHGIDKGAVVRDAQAGGGIVAFAGDGYPDLDAALLVPENLRFAKSALAETLRQRGEGFRPFEVWSEVAEALLRKT